MQPFQLRPEGVSGPKMLGRLTRLGTVAEGILSQHDYPEPVGRLLAESLALTASLAGGLKFDGIFSLQIQAKGPVSLMVVDATSTGELRGYARFDRAQVPPPAEINGTPVPQLCGDGLLALTVDTGPDAERYQGVVELAGDTLTDCAHHYFRHSEQMNAAIVLAADRHRRDGRLAWRSGSLLLQQLPEASGEHLSSDDGDDPWRRAMMLLSTGTKDELLDRRLSADRYLHRLFHQEGLGLAPARRWRRGCRCSAERMQAAIRGLADDDRRSMTVDGRIDVTCEFCNLTRSFDPDTLELLPDRPNRQ